MQIRAIALYSHNGKRRDLPLRLGALNTISGPSRTGKSEIVKIIDYCCGRSTPKLAPGPITRKVAWFATLFEGADGRRVLVARPQPTAKKTTTAMLAFGTDLALPEPDELERNADTAAVRAALNDLIGLRDYDPEQYDGARERLRASVGHAVQFCLQNQNELMSPEHLFHRGNDPEVASDFKDLFPFFLGADTPEALERRRRATELRRQIRAAERRLAQAQSALTADTRRDRALLEQAAKVGLANPELVAVDPRALLMQLAAEPLRPEATATPDATNTPEVQRQVIELKEQLRLLQERRAGLARLRDDGRDHTHELEVQVGRLGIVEHLAGSADGDIASCPACGNSLTDPDETLTELVEDAQVVARQLGDLRATSQELRSAERRLDELITETRDRHDRARAALEEARRVDDAAAALTTQGETRAFVLGLISEHLRQASAASTEAVAELNASIVRLSEQLEAVTAGASGADITEAVEVRLEAIAEDMTAWSRRLELEGADSGLVRIDRRTLNVTVSTRAGRVELSAMGSGANHVGYHLAAHLGLHKHFVLQQRPVPRFIVFDQPSLPFFPRTAPNKDAAQKDVDWEAVRYMFLLVNEVVEELQGRLQIFMTDHALFDEDKWFMDALVEDWHDGTKLVPSAWPEREEAGGPSE